LQLTEKILFENGFFRTILDNTHDGINIVDLDGNIIYSNSHSAEYLNTTKDYMIGKHISLFYPKAVLLNVLETQKPVLDQKIHFVAGNKYVVSSYPIFIDEEFVGAYSIFRDVRAIDELNRKVKYLELHLGLSNAVEEESNIIGTEKSLKEALIRARRTVGSIGGPRHSIITGESGTGKTMLANVIFNYAKKVSVLNNDAPFIEVNCAQFTNPDIAAIEIFGSEKGAFTGSTMKKGLFEQANGGILFLDEAHALEQYQNLLLKAIESGRIRRIGGSKEFDVDVIIIAASTRNLSDVLLPELYQRLAQYEIYLPSLDERSREEKELLFNHFINKYQQAVNDLHKINYKVQFTDKARKLILGAEYPRNIRQFRDIINFSIDAAAPLITDVQDQADITTIVDVDHLPFQIDEQKPAKVSDQLKSKIDSNAKKLIREYLNEGLGPRKIEKKMIEHGYDIKYYKIAYFKTHDE
jgi:arginine utilization regulatory protein